MKENQENPKKSIYRSAALASYSNAKWFEHHFISISYKNRLIKGTFILLTIGGFFRLFFGSHPVEVNGMAIAMNIGGLSFIEASCSARVKKMKKKTGDFVKEGESIAILSNPAIESFGDKNLHEIGLKEKSVYSPVSGLLLEWLIRQNQSIDAGDLLARIEIQNDENPRKVFFGYLPAGQGKKLQLNTEVFIELPTINAGEYGTILGKIISISPDPLTYESLMIRFQDPSLIRHFLQDNEAVVEIVIEPKRDDNTFSGYRWTSTQGAPIQLSSGTLCIFRCRVE